MSLHPNNDGRRGPRLVPWLIRKIAPAVLIGGVIGFTVSWLAARDTPLLRGLSNVAAVACTLVALLYFYGAAFVPKGGGGGWTGLARAGVALSGLAALVLAAKLAFPERLPGAQVLYFTGAMFVALVVRPSLESADVKPPGRERGGPTPPPEAE